MNLDRCKLNPRRKMPADKPHLYFKWNRWNVAIQDGVCPNELTMAASEWAQEQNLKGKHEIRS